jgi:class 3 adenylate cyclase
MALENFNELLLKSAGVALAVFDRESEALLFYNKRLVDWFSSAAEENATLGALFPGIDREKMEQRFTAGRGYNSEQTVKVGARETVIALRLEAQERDGDRVLVMEGQNITKLRELEYMIDSYSKMIERQNRDLRKEKDRAEKLLLNIMPKTVYEEWRSFGITTPQRYDASVLMLDFVDFTEMAVSQDPAELIKELNDIFTAFDRIVEEFSCERIKTIGDAYIAVSGLPEPTPEHAQNIARVALRFLRYLKRRNDSHATQWRGRIGLASGPVVGSIVGIQKYVYDIFGPGVNLAARMEALSGPMEITLPAQMANSVRSEFALERGEAVEVKGFGKLVTYKLLGDESGKTSHIPAPHWSPG